MRTCLVILAIAFFFTQAHASAPSAEIPLVPAARLRGFVEIEPGRSLYVDWDKSALPEKTVVLINGLTYDTSDWNAFAKALKARGYGVLRYDPMAMGKTLLKTGVVRDSVRVEDQARDLDLLTRKLGLTGRLNLVGLSYGGGVLIAFARDYSARIENAFLMAPYTEPVPQQDQWIRLQIAVTRATFPMNRATDDELYGYFLRQNVVYVYPYAEPSVNDNKLKPEAIFQMVQGIRKFPMKSAATHFPPRSIQLMVAGNDQYIPRELLNDFWAGLPKQARGTRIIIDSTEHKIPEAQPDFAAIWIDKVITQQVPSNGRNWLGNPKTGEFKPTP